MPQHISSAMIQEDAPSNVPAITIGLDLSDKTARYCVLDQQGRISDRGQVRLTRSELTRQFENVDHARIALEVGGQSAWIADLLEGLGHEVIVANARELQSISHSPRKSDPRDAEHLARLARLDPALLRPIRHRRPERRLDILIIRSRAAVVECRTRLINSVRGMAKVFGEPIPAAASGNFAQRALAALSPALGATLRILIEQIEILSNTITEYDSQIGKLSEKYSDEVARLQEVNGVGALTAVAFVLTLDTPERFAHSRDVGPFLGLVPARSQSGERDPQLRITKAGDKYLRKLLVQCAQHTLTRFGSPSALRDWGLSQAAPGRKSKKRAIVAVARKLAVLLHRLWTTQEHYKPYPQGPPKAA